ncbi:hypothetical protein HOY80DRAFT_1134122 [Tuber brumale]|nr:hypothetical protein HOY80DRAFT_1134122 [Tuber brumale]
MSSSPGTNSHQQTHLPLSPPLQYTDFTGQTPTTPTPATQNFDHSLTATFPTPPPSLPAAPTNPQSPLDQFFARYPTFTPTPTTAPPPANWSIHHDFARLREHKRWVRGCRQERRARACFRKALINEFNHIFGMNDEDLESWKRLCRVVGVPEERIPVTLTQCRRTISTTHVNLIDLVETRYPGRGAPQRFRTLTDLGTYTRREKKFFPREASRAGNTARVELYREYLRLYVRVGSELRRRWKGGGGDDIDIDGLRSLHAEHGSPLSGL